jgi:hypothetical protein
MNPTCKYCKKDLSFSSNYGEKEKVYYCNDHKCTVKIWISNYDYNITYIYLYSYSKSLHIDIDYVNHHMLISNNYLFLSNNIICCKLPIDNSLTPENIDKKIQTYLTFK